MSDAGCPTGTTSSATQTVDLVVLIDTSGSMSDEATNLSAAAEAAILAAAKKCPSDLRVEWFGLEGTWAGTKFTTVLRDFLHGLAISDGQMSSTLGDQEDGAAAISDLCNYFNWRPGAARAILYLSDEALEGGDPQDNADVVAANKAIADATNAIVKVHMYAGTQIATMTELEFQRVASGTGGQFFSATSGGVGGFQAVLEQVICASSATKCPEARIPAVQPCFELRWGDGPDDHIETEDFEVLCITACNPYANLCFKDVTIVATRILDATNKPVKTLPDGTPSVLVKPSEVIFFGDLEPCGKDGKSCVSREVVLKTSGALAGKYRLQIAACFSVEIAYAVRDQFVLDLVRS